MKQLLAKQPFVRALVLGAVCLGLLGACAIPALDAAGAASAGSSAPSGEMTAVSSPSIASSPVFSGQAPAAGDVTLAVAESKYALGADGAAPTIEYMLADVSGTGAEYVDVPQLSHWEDGAWHAVDFAPGTAFCGTAVPVGPGEVRPLDLNALYGTLEPGLYELSFTVQAHGGETSVSAEFTLTQPAGEA